jgi:hypothetical protein
MSVSGNLRTMALADLLQWLADGAKTGTLKLDDGTVRKRIHFANGRIVATSSTDAKEYLGHFLVSHGYISEQELATALEMQESNEMLLGEILVSIGVMDEGTLEQMLYLKAEETLYELFTWTEGEFQFVDDEVPDEKLQPIDLSVTSVVLRGTQRLDEWRRIRELIPSNDAVVVSVGELHSDDPGASAILGAINDDRTITEIAMHTHSSDFHVCRALVEWIEAGWIKTVRPRQLSAAEPRAISANGSGSLVGEGRRRLDAGDYSRGLRYLRAARSLEPDSHEVVAAIEEGEERVRATLKRGGVKLTSVPRLSPGASHVAGHEITPDEGFLLSRIDGRTDLKTILVISPMDPLEAQLSFMRLRDAGYVDLD